MQQRLNYSNYRFKEKVLSVKQRNTKLGKNNFHFIVLGFRFSGASPDTCDYY